MRVKRIAFAIIVAWECCCWSSLAFAQRRAVTLDNFDGPVQNGAGGYRNTFERNPSTADAMMVREARLGNSGLGLQLSVERQDEGFCGYWIHFFDMKADPRKYLDATQFQYLSFWVKGAEGGEKFSIKFADERWIVKEDSVPVGSVDEFLPGGVTKRWQEVVIPLNANVTSLDFKAFGGVTFDFDEPGKATVFIDDIALKTSRAVGVSKAIQQQAKFTEALVANGLKWADPDSNFGRAMWVWSLDPMLDDATRAEELFTFCEAHKVRQIWVQIAYDLVSENSESQNGKAVSSCVLRRQDELRQFLRAAHQHEIQVHALDGYPEHAQREYHHISLSVVDAIIAFNDNQMGEDQFDGIHFDNEPHLLVGWYDPQRRQQILFEFLTLNGECQRRVSRASSELKFGVDIPFWLQDRDPQGGEAIGVVAYNGRRQAASYHLLEMLDNVGVMNYRDLAQGADGMIAHGRDILKHADTAAHAQVYMGVETFASPPTDVLFAVGRTRDQFQAAVRGESRDLAKLSRLDGHRLRVFDDGEYVHVGIEIAEASTMDQRIAIAGTISTLARAFGVLPTTDAGTLLNIQSNFSNCLSKDTEWSSVSPLTVRDPDTKQTHLLMKATSTMLEKITFADDTPERLKSQLEFAERTFGEHSSYAGIAVHDYEAYRKLVESPARIENDMVSNVTH